MSKPNIEALARQIARDYVAEWVMSDWWYGYPNGRKQEREAEDKYMPRAR